MSRRYRLAVVGCGQTEGAAGATGFGMAHMHAHAFLETGRCDLIAAADIRRENVEAFAGRWGNAATYVDYRAMLAEARPDLVSICTWSHLHAEMVIACAGAGVKAIHCEKPMATTWSDARRMVDVCARLGAQLTINHQNRFREPYWVARDLVRGGAIGELQSLQGASSNLTNSHWVDLLFFYNDETPAEWVIGQIDSRSGGTGADGPREERAICYVQFVNGVHAVLLTGADAQIGCSSRLIGSEGSIEVHGGPPRVRIQSKREGTWRSIDVPDNPDWQPPLDRAIADLVTALDEGQEPEMSGRWALQATEVIFAAYESSRRGNRVDLPLIEETGLRPQALPSGDLRSHAMAIGGTGGLDG